MSSDLHPSTPSYGGPDSAPGGEVPPQSEVWSAAAIAGFVLSLVGCLMVTGVAGLIFGVIGLGKTSGGRRRGRGLAIAAIPIAILMTALGGVATYVSYTFMVRSAERFKGVVVMLRTSPEEAALRDAMQRHFSPDFRDTVGDADFRVWLDTMREKHGSLVGEPQNMQPVQQAGVLAFKFDGKFVNGTAPVIIRFSQSAPFELLVDDIEVDGQSPRGVP